ncbi:MAG: hydrolase [Methylicorpusculum sp.]|uniref:hydrolase n=1 Tax=Methylicorpusculum sp. TaxID=2713644 RepID=UPI002731AF6F|nr:hydrolase [Methylicorpusculum sp.]MDP3531149.1 hydrolase [Methylicorpusculum sp.]
MHNLIFADLDDTLFQTLRKCGNLSSDGTGAIGTTLQPRAYLKDGSTISYATPKQQRLWQWLSESGQIIPVTARNFDAFSRVDLPFKNEVVLNHGAVILDKEHKLDLEWHAYMADVLPTYHDELLDLWEQLEGLTGNGSGLRARLIEDFGRTWYGVIKHADADENALQALLCSTIKKHESVASGRLYCHSNGNNLAVIPEVIGKANAVNFLRSRYAELFESIFTIGIGDSITDASFMALCDYAIIPKNTQLGALLDEM